MAKLDSTTKLNELKINIVDTYETFNTMEKDPNQLYFIEQELPVVADSLETGHTFKVNLASENASTAFNGTADITDIGVSGTLPVKHGGTGFTTATYKNAVVIGNSSTVTNPLQTVRTASGAFYATGQDVKPSFGTLPVAQGGTGQTSIANIQAGKDSAGNTITSTYLKLSGGNMTGHIYLTGSQANSSTANTSQLIFGTSTTEHIAISSNTKALILNPTRSSTTNQIVLYLDKASKFPSGIEANITGNLNGKATTAGTADVANSVTWGNVSSKPTTLSGYGITDAKIDNGTITLGSNSITPLTVHQTVTNENATLSWDTATTVATIGNTDIKISLPTNPNTDTKVTSVDNHYAPTANASSELTASLSGTTGNYAINTEYTVLTGVKAQRDAKGHITGLTYTAQKIKDTNTTYTLVDLVGSTAIGSATKPVYWNGSKFATITSYEGNASTATTANKLSNTTKIGDTNKPVYFTANGVPTAINYTIAKSVPSDAKFTDTTYSAGTGISLSGTTFSNSGVRATTIYGNYLRVNTNGTDADLTIPYATNANKLTQNEITIQTGDTAQQHITLQTLMEWLITTKKYIPSNTICYKYLPVSWAYASNDILQLSCNGTNYELQLAGCIIEFWGKATNYNTGVFRLGIHSNPSANFTANSGYTKFPNSSYVEYTCNGSSYNPTWRMVTAASNSAPSLSWGTSSTIGSVNGVNLTVTMPVNPNTDTKVTQNNTTAANDYRILLSTSANDTAETNTVNKNTNLRYNPSTNTLSTGNISSTGNLNITGNTNLNGETYAESVTVGSLLVNGNTNFAQIPTAPTPAATSNDTSIATTAFVMNAFTANDAMVFKGVVNANGDLPITHKQGWTYRVATANSYAGKTCEVGDIIICVTDGTTANNDHWAVIQNNVDGAVYRGANAFTDANIIVADSTNGKVKSSGKTITTTAPTSSSTDTTVPTSKAVWSAFLPLSGGTVTGTVVLSKNQDLSGTANNSPALIVGGAATAVHLELDANEIQAKTNGTSVAQLYINNDGGLVTVGSGGLAITSLTASQAVSTDANKKLVSTNLTVSDPTASGTGITYIASVSQSATGKISASKSTVRSASTSQTGVTQYTADNLNTWINQLTTGSSTPTDADYYISQYVGGGTTTTTYHRRPMSALWTYIKDKITTGTYWANIKISDAAAYNATPEMATLKLNGNTSATATSTSNVSLIYNSTTQALNFVFA